MAGGAGYVTFCCCIVEAAEEAAKNFCCWASKLVLVSSLILLENEVLEFIGEFCNSWQEFSNSTFDESRTASRLAWRISVANIVDMAVACLIDLATASKSLDSACVDIVCCINKYAAEEKRSACELIATNLWALFFSQFSRFLIGMEHFPLLERSNREASDSNWGMLSVGKNWLDFCNI